MNWQQMDRPGAIKLLSINALPCKIDVMVVYVHDHTGTGFYVYIEGYHVHTAETLWRAKEFATQRYQDMVSIGCFRDKQ